MNVHFDPFSIWNSNSFQTELPELLGLENEQPFHFLLNPTLHKFSLPFQVYFNLQPYGQMSICFCHVYYSNLVVM